MLQLRWKNMLVITFLVSMVGWSCVASEFKPVMVITSMSDAFAYIWNDFLPPDFVNWQHMLKYLLDTIYMCYIATFISVVISLFISLCASQTTTPVKWLYPIARGIASVLRTIPSTVWVLLLVVSVGIGLTSGVLAMILAGVGWLTRAFAEVFDEMKQGQMEALRATGAGWVHVVSQGILPQSLPAILAWALYAFDNSIRDSTIIGMVGGGGIGFYLQESVKLFQFQEMTAGLVALLALIIGIEFATNMLRRKLL